MTTDKLLVVSDGIDQFSTDIAGSAARISGMLEEMVAELRPLEASWTGAASDAFQSARAEWDAAMADCNAILERIGRSVDAGSVTFIDTETQIESIWA